MLTQETISAIVDELDGLSDEESAYLNRKTGEIFSATHNLLGEYSNDSNIESLPDWLREDFVKYQEVQESVDWLSLPSKFDVHEWSIMKDLASTLDDKNLQTELLDAIDGTGAFRQFKNIIRRYRNEDKWFAFRADVLKEIVIAWLDANSIEYVKDVRNHPS